MLCSGSNLKGQCHAIFCSVLFHESSSPQASENSIRVINIFFWKFTEIFASQGAPLVSMTPAVNLPLIPLVSLIPVAYNGNLIRLFHLSELEEKKYIQTECYLFYPKVSKNLWLNIFSICHRCTVNDTGGAPWAANIFANFRINLKRIALMGYSAAGGNWFMKKTWSRISRGTVPLSSDSCDREFRAD